MRSLLFAAGLVFVSSGATVYAVDNPACAKFQNPLEYNACLARQGPRAGATLAVPEPGGAAHAARGVGSMHAFAGAHRTGGRVRMEFTIKSR